MAEERKIPQDPCWEQFTSQANRINVAAKSLLQENQKARLAEKCNPEPFRWSQDTWEMRNRYRKQWVDRGGMTYHKSSDEIV